MTSRPVSVKLTGFFLFSFGNGISHPNGSDGDMKLPALEGLARTPGSPSLRGYSSAAGAGTQIRKESKQLSRVHFLRRDNVSTACSAHSVHAHRWRREAEKAVGTNIAVDNDRMVIIYAHGADGQLLLLQHMVAIFAKTFFFWTQHFTLRIMM